MLVSVELLVGALAGLLPTFLFSRLVLILVPPAPGLRRVFLANAAAWVACALLAASFVATPGEPWALRVAVMLIFPQLCWLILDIVRHQVAITATLYPTASEPVRRRLI